MVFSLKYVVIVADIWRRGSLWHSSSTLAQCLLLCSFPCGCLWHQRDSQVEQEWSTLPHCAGRCCIPHLCTHQLWTNIRYKVPPTLCTIILYSGTCTQTVNELQESSLYISLCPLYRQIGGKLEVLRLSIHLLVDWLLICNSISTGMAPPGPSNN